MSEHPLVASGKRMASQVQKGVSKKGWLNMRIDNSGTLMENSGLFAAQPQLDPVKHDMLGIMPVVVLDFDTLRHEATVKKLKSSTEMCRFVVWFPWNFTPAEVVGFHRELVDSGATLIEKASPDQTFEACWLERKAELDERERRRVERAVSRSGRAGSFSAKV